MPGKKMTGVVVSHKMKKTAVVAVTRTIAHRMYRKSTKVQKSYKIHDEKDVCQVGDTVEMKECRPLSRDKRWTLVRVISHGEVRKGGGET